MLYNGFLCFFTPVSWGSETRFRLLSDFIAMTDRSIFSPIAGVEVNVEVGSNRSFDKLGIQTCGDCQSVFLSSNILGSVENVSWSEIDTIDLKTTVSCINVWTVTYILYATTSFPRTGVSTC